MRLKIDRPTRQQLKKHGLALHNRFARRRQRLQQEQRTTTLLATPLVSTKTAEIGGTSIVVVTALRRGSLAAMLDAVLQVGIPEDASEEAVREALASKINLPEELIPLIIASRLTTSSLHGIDPDDIQTRTANVFVTERPQHWLAGLGDPEFLAPSMTLFTSHYGPGTKVFLLAP